MKTVEIITINILKEIWKDIASIKQEQNSISKIRRKKLLESKNPAAMKNSIVKLKDYK